MPEDAARIERSTARYADRFLAFLDIVGFRELVKESALAGYDGPLHKLMTTIGIVTKHAASIPSTVGSIAAFSDSIVISSTSIVDIVAGATQLWQEYARHGVFIRGGVVRGLVYHQGATVYGPAMVSAYEIESSVASVPRIVLATDLYGHLPLSPEVSSSIPSRMIRRDADGQLRIDTFSTFGWQEPHLVPDWIAKSRPFIEIGLGHPSPTVQQKYRWLALRWNEQVSQHSSWRQTEFNIW